MPDRHAKTILELIPIAAAHSRRSGGQGRKSVLKRVHRQDPLLVLQNERRYRLLARRPQSKVDLAAGQHLGAEGHLMDVVLGHIARCQCRWRMNRTRERPCTLNGCTTNCHAPATRDRWHPGADAIRPRNRWQRERHHVVIGVESDQQDFVVGRPALRRAALPALPFSISPTQRACRSCHCSAVFSSPDGLNHVMSFTPSRSLPAMQEAGGGAPDAPCAAINRRDERGQDPAPPR